VAILAADQSFPACLPAYDGECLRVVRVEDGSLREVVLALVDCIGKGELSTGTVILLGSITHMATVGTAQYALDWVRSRFWLKDRLGDRVTIIPAPVVPLGGIEGTSVIRTLMEVSEWFTVVDSTEALLAKHYTRQFINAHLGSTEHGVELNERQCLRLPVSFDSRGFLTMVSEGWGSRPDGVPPLPQAAEKAIVLPLLEQLNEAFSLGLDTAPSFERTVVGIGELAQARASGLKYLVIGGSHADRTADALCASGLEVTRLTSSGWRATRTSVALVLDKINKLPHHDVVVLQGLDNSAYFCLGEDGTMSLPKKGADGRYHVEGELRVANKDQTTALAKTMAPILQAVPDSIRIVITCLPRYTVIPCCEDSDHLIGRGREMEDRVTADLRAMKRNVRSAFYGEKTGQVKLLDPAEVAGWHDRVNYTDPVHLRESWYADLAAAVQTCATNGPPTQGEGADSGTKRKRSDTGPGGSAPPVANRGTGGRGRGRGRGGFSGYATGTATRTGSGTYAGSGRGNKWSRNSSW